MLQKQSWKVLMAANSIEEQTGFTGARWKVIYRFLRKNWKREVEIILEILQKLCVVRLVFKNQDWRIHWTAWVRCYECQMDFTSRVNENFAKAKHLSPDFKEKVSLEWIVSLIKIREIKMRKVRQSVILGNWFITTVIWFHEKKFSFKFTVWKFLAKISCKQRFW